MDCSVEQCELCHGLRGHKCLKDEMFNTFDLEYKAARREFQQLSVLFREVCWYSFETKCRNWDTPWYVSWGGSTTTQYGHVFDEKNGKVRARFPLWYNGPVSDAPPLPPDIVYVELQAARAHMCALKESRYAPYDYAPGGRKYEALVRDGTGVADYNLLWSLRKNESNLSNTESSACRN